MQNENLYNVLCANEVYTGFALQQQQIRAIFTAICIVGVLQHHV